MKSIVIVVGTRPAAIKLVPLYQALKKANIPTTLCATFQHDELLQQVFDIFQVTPDIKLNIMKKDQDLFYLTQIVLEGVKNVLNRIQPQLTIVQGDTVTAFASALAAFYLKIPVGHIEAGLRTGDKYSPFPEEIYRKSISSFASYHFAPTSLNIGNLLAENIDRKSIFCTGNTIVDSLQWVEQQITNGSITIDSSITETVISLKKNKQKIILLTAHRRESFNGGLQEIFMSVKDFAATHDDVSFIFPAHPNPNVQKAIQQTGLNALENIIIIPPTEYKELIYLIHSADFVMTDSGGIQEETMSMGKKVIVLRKVTERIEGVWEGLGILVGTNKKLIANAMQKLYNAPNEKIVRRSIYGDGKATQRIVTIIKDLLNEDFIAEKEIVAQQVMQNI